jgi:lipopolysaccharide/colanic/teichoic acid biosynthesis glycosyltransferase
MLFMLRFLDFVFALIGLILGLPILLVISLVIWVESGNPFFIQARLGKDKKIFKLVKFRTMAQGTKSMASHLADSAQISKLGAFLRKTKLDELPQLYNVLVGDMSLVGPRPNLDNQIELIGFRDRKGVYSQRPGITGLSQIQNIDMSTPELLALTDKQMIESLTLSKYFTYIIKTATGSGFGDAVK